MNAHFDYDEGTYLLIARLINHGILPYRDVFAVHPPLYYYALAIWLRIFGDSYITGRVLSLFLGLASVFLAYLTGRELNGEKLGLVFAFLVAIDPLAIMVNTLVLHESMVEFFTLLSLLFLVKYMRSGEKTHAYLAIAVASLGTSAKFTMIPYLLTVFVFLLLYESTELRSLLLSSVEVVTRRQGYIIPLTYLLWTMLAMAVVTLYPTETSRIIASVPGIHPITKVGHVYTCLLFLFLWIFLTVFILEIRYFQPLKHALRALIGVVRHGAVLSSIVVLSKAVVELPLGVFVSKDYVTQTYLAQSHRGYPFIGVFWVMGKVLSYVQGSSLESLVYYAPLFILVAVVIAFGAFGHRTKFSRPLKALLLLNVVFYLVLIPIIPNPRFIYPLLLVSYLYLLSGIVIKFQNRKILAIAITLILLLATVDVGIAYNYPRGLLRIPCAPHTKELREDLSNYIHKENLSGTYLSINPMDAYYLGLPVVPYLVDTFGLGYLRGYSLVNLTVKYHPNYVIYDTWMFSMIKSKPLRKAYEPLLNYTLHNSTLLFVESLRDRETIELFKLGRQPHQWGVDARGTTLRLYHWNNTIEIKFNVSGIDKLLIKAIGNSYVVVLKGVDGTHRGRLLINDDGVTLSISSVGMEVSFDGIPLKNGSLVRKGEFKSLQLCTLRECFTLEGNVSVSEGRVHVLEYLQIRARR